MTFLCLSSEPDPYCLLERTVAQHIFDGLHSGNPVAADLAQSLLTELEVAGVPVDQAVEALQAVNA